MAHVITSAPVTAAFRLAATRTAMPSSPRMRSANARGPLRIAADHAHLGQGQDLAQAEELEAGLHPRAEAGHHAGVGPGQVAGGHGGRRSGADGGEEAGLHQGQRGAGLRIGEQVGGVDGGQARAAVALHDRHQLGAESADAGEAPNHGQEHPVPAHRQHRAREGARPGPRRPRGRHAPRPRSRRREGAAASSTSRPRIRISADLRLIIRLHGRLQDDLSALVGHLVACRSRCRDRPSWSRACP